MDKIIEEQIRGLIAERRVYQIVIVVGAVLVVISFMTSHFDKIIKAGPSLQKIWKFFQNKWFSNAIFRADMLRFMNTLQLKLNEIEKEVKYNGGSITTVDAIKRLEYGQKVMVDQIIHLKGLRDTGDMYDSVMRFRYHPERGCTMINESFLKAFGHYEGRVIGFNFEELVHPDDIADMRLKWNQAANNLTDFRDTQQIRDAMGFYHPCELMAKPIKDSGGKLIEYSGVIEMKSL